MQSLPSYCLASLLAASPRARPTSRSPPPLSATSSTTPSRWTPQARTSTCATAAAPSPPPRPPSPPPARPSSTSTASPPCCSCALSTTPSLWRTSRARACCCPSLPRRYGFSVPVSSLSHLMTRVTHHTGFAGCFSGACQQHGHQPQLRRRQLSVPREPTVHRVCRLSRAHLPGNFLPSSTSHHSPITPSHRHSSSCCSVPVFLLLSHSRLRLLL